MVPIATNSYKGEIPIPKIKGNKSAFFNFSKKLNDSKINVSSETCIQD